MFKAFRTNFMVVIPRDRAYNGKGVAKAGLHRRTGICAGTGIRHLQGTEMFALK